MASVNWLRRVVDRPWSVPDFIWRARNFNSAWRNSFRLLAGALRVVLYFVRKINEIGT